MDSEKEANVSLEMAMSKLALHVSNVARGELQDVKNHAELIEKLNLKTAAEYDDYADFASGLLVFVERLRQQNDSLCSHLQVIDEIEEEVRNLEAIVSTLDNYTSSLEAKLRAADRKQKEKTATERMEQRKQ